MDTDAGLNFWLTQWNWQPSIILGTVLIIGFYIYATGPLREKYHLGPPLRMGQMLLFLIGVNVIFLALFSPLDRLGDDYLFSAHMLQHMCLTIIGPPLLLLGMPGWLIAPLLRKRVLLMLGKILTFPAVAFVLYNVNFWLWHAPALYDATLTNQSLHIFEHLTFIVTGVIYWWPVFSPVEAGLPRLSLGGQVLYLFLSGMPTVALGAGLTFVSPLYAPYVQQAVRVGGLSPTTDQQLGGLLMWVPGNILFIVIASFLFIRWMRAQDEKQRAEDERLAAQVEAEATEGVEST